MDLTCVNFLSKYDTSCICFVLKDGSRKLYQMTVNTAAFSMCFLYFEYIYYAMREVLGNPSTLNGSGHETVAVLLPGFAIN